MIQDISLGLSEYVEEDLDYTSRGEVLEELLTDACIALGKAGKLTENKADLEMVLGVVGAYLITKSRGTLPEDSKPPSYIFNRNLFPILDNGILEEDTIDAESEQEAG